jgi:hypothetical protein
MDIVPNPPLKTAFILGLRHHFIETDDYVSFDPVLMTLWLKPLHFRYSHFTIAVSPDQFVGRIGRLTIWGIFKAAPLLPEEDYTICRTLTHFTQTLETQRTP